MTFGVTSLRSPVHTLAISSRCSRIRSPFMDFNGRFDCIPLSTVVIKSVLYYQLCSGRGLRLIFVNTSKRMALFARSSMDSEPTDSDSGTTRLIKVFQNLQVQLNARIQKFKENLPIKFLFFLLGFYCATAFSTVIGQTGDWDILSAAVAVVVVEGIGAVMYRSSASLISGVRIMIIMFNYWKAGLSLGLFLDSFNWWQVLKIFVLSLD